MEQDRCEQDRSAAGPTRNDVPTRRVTSESLLADAPALVIVHNGRGYLLRVTQNGKLILTA